MHENRIAVASGRCIDSSLHRPQRSTCTEGQPEVACLHLPFLSCPTGGRTGEAIVDAALSALSQLVKDRLGGRSGGYSSGKQVRL